MQTFITRGSATSVLVRYFSYSQVGNNRFAQEMVPVLQTRKCVIARTNPLVFCSLLGFLQSVMRPAFYRFLVESRGWAFGRCCDGSSIFWTNCPEAGVALIPDSAAPLSVRSTCGVRAASDRRSGFQPLFPETAASRQSVPIAHRNCAGQANRFDFIKRQ